MSIELSGVLCITFLLAGFVKGVIGMGLPTVSLAALSLTLGLPVALQLMVVPSALTNLYQALDGKHFVYLLRRFWSLLLCTVLGVWFAFGWLFLTHPRSMTVLLGVTLVCYSAAGLTGWKLTRVRGEALWSPLTGVLTGFLAGATGSLVVPFVFYMQSLRLDRDQLIQVMGISFCVSTCAIGVSIAGQSRFDDGMLTASAFSLLPAIAGMQLGRWVRSRLSANGFQRTLHIGLLATGLHLIGADSGVFPW